MPQRPAQVGQNEDGIRDAADRRADLGACQKLVQSYGQEVLRTAYLLTDDRQRAWSIARQAFLELFKELPRLSDDVDLRARLLGHTGRAFLAPSSPDAEPSLPVSIPLEGVAERFHVDNVRSRTRAALMLLDPAARLALLLRDLNTLEVEQVSALAHQRPDVLAAALEASRRRVRGYIDLPAHEPLRATLTVAGFDAPNASLWPALADDAADLLRRADGRSRMLTAGVLAAVTAVLVIALMALFGGSPDERAVAEPLTNALNDPAPFPTIAAPRAVGTSPARSARIPSPVTTEIVPDTLLLALEDTRASDGLAHLAEFRPELSIAIRPLGERLSPTRDEWPPLLSTDGRQLLIVRYESRGGETRVNIVSFNSRTLSMNWQTELTRLPGAGSIERKPDMFVSLAADDDHVYASLHPWQSAELIQVVVLGLTSGQVVNEWPVNMAGLAANDVRLILPPGGDRLYLFAIVQDGATVGGVMQLGYYGYQLPGGEQLHSRSLIESDANRVFYMYQGNITADGQRMYGLTRGASRGSLALQFFDLFSGAAQPPTQISFGVDGGLVPFQEAASHDGRWLYVFSPLSAEMAIVDLQTRKLLGIIPLDVQLGSGAGLAGANPRDNTMQISPDGGRMYAIGGAADAGSSTSGVWVIDTSAWTVTDHWLPESNPNRILLSGDGQTLYLHEQGSQPGAPAGRLWAIDTASGEQILDDNLSFLPESTEIELQFLAGVYRKQFGHSPNLADVRPVDNRAFTSLPAMQATLNPLSIRAGEPVTIDVRFINPLSKEPLVEGSADTRYQPSSGLRAVLTNSTGEAGDIILDLGRLGYAEYRGTVVIPGPGDWTLSLVNDWSSPQSAGRLITTNATVQVQRPPSVIGAGSFNVVPEGDPGYYSPAPPDP